MYCYVFFGLTFNVFEVCCHRVLGPRLWYCHLHQLHLESIMGWRLWQRWLTFSMNFAGAVSRFQRRFWPFFLPQSTKVSSWMRAIMLRSGALIFRSPFFFTGPCCETWTVQYFECEDWLHDFNDFSKGPEGERMVNIGYMSKTNLLIISVHYFPGFHLFYRGIFRTPKFLRTFSVTLFDWQCLLQ